jgi:DNA-directed RNA polymerase subunit alpha
MRVRWRGLELPSRVTCDAATLTDTYGKFVIEPFEKGYGHTLGNSLRRILLSSLEGSAVTAVQIENVKHEFSTIPGVLEDVTDLVLNIKQLVVRMHTDEPKTIHIDVSRQGEVTAADITTDPTVEVVNPALHIASITEPVNFRVEMIVRRGRGYVTAEENTPEDLAIGFIPVDSVFSPVLRVNYRVDDTRVGQKVNYDKLSMEIWTDGTISPEMALVEASKILRKHLNPFVHYFEIGRELQEEMAVEEEGAQVDDAVAEKLAMDISELHLSVRASNCLEAQKLSTVAELATKTDAELLKIRNFGKTSLTEVKSRLTDLGLSLGMDPELVKSKLKGRS